ncbi:transforming growth factor beta activator LRRC32-like [Dendropsophus ebraccatus]|uniref:transforming growth factor beta activator LRRC32-like n=1 Tax=Dendropsophus ebraccatus TaxID=150705 RepID=UPI0038313012
MRLSGAGGADLLIQGFWMIHIFLMVLWCEIAVTHPAQMCFQHLSEVKCRHSALHSMPKSLPDNLKALDLSHNFIQKLTNISMSRLHKLENFNIEHNHLETIEDGALNALLQLHSLNLASNRLHKHCLANKSVFGSLRSLKRLNIANNMLDGDMVHCYLSNITSLVDLDLSWNTIAVLFSGMFDGVPWLTELDLSNNNIAEIESGTFDSLQYLRVLNLAFNAIGCISSFDLPQLHLLNLSSNSLEVFVSQKSDKVYQLRNLDLSRNSLVSFPILPKINMVQHLNLSGNNFAELFPLSNETEENLKMAFWYETIADLDLPSAMENIISHLTSIMDLDLSYNQLTSFPWRFLSYVNSLQKVNMAGNCLSNMTYVSYSNRSQQKKRNRITALQSLRTLDIHGNFIDYIPQQLFDFLPRIEQINIKNNNIRLCHPKESTSSVCTTFSGVHHLRYLNLQNNSIKDLPPEVFLHTSLYSLDLSDNIGLNIHEGALSEVQQSLQVMSLRSNSMNDSQVNLPCVTCLKTLDLSGNRLTEIPANLHCSAIESLNLQNNALRHLDERTVLAWMDSLKQMFISGNPFECCSLRWLDSLLISKVNISDLENIYCIDADSNTNVAVHNSSIQRLSCHQNTAKNLLTILITILIVFVLLSIFCVLTMGNRKVCLTRKSTSNKVAPEILPSFQTVQSEEKQACFTISSKGT